jgi:hypothetical protein
VTKVDTYTKKDTMEVAGICSRILKNHQPAMMFIDVVGIGAAWWTGCASWAGDRRSCRSTRAARRTSEKLYVNKGAETWGDMKKWLEDGPVQIPDDDALQADLQNRGFKYDSNQRLVMEKTEDMKKRGLRSPDMAVSVALTFSEPVGMPLPPLPEQEPEYFGVGA